MKWLISLIALLFMVAPAMAGEDPYVAIIGNDIGANPFYISPKQLQFAYNQDIFGVPVCFGTFPPTNQFTRLGGAGCEQFRSQTPPNQPEICDTFGIASPGNLPPFVFRGMPNAVVRAGNTGFFEFYIRLPKKPNAINICFECGVLKPDAFSFEGFNAVELCAANTGERVAPGLCVRQEVNPGVNPIIAGALPQVTAIAYPGPFNAFQAFNLTAYRNPGNYTGGIAQPITANSQIQVLNGDARPTGVSVPTTRIMLKSCMDKCINIKLPVTGQINFLGQEETDLEFGDLIYVLLTIPRQNTVDVYCSPESVSLKGIGEAPF